MQALISLLVFYLACPASCAPLARGLLLLLQSCTAPAPAPGAPSFLLPRLSFHPRRPFPHLPGRFPRGHRRLHEKCGWQQAAPAPASQQRAFRGGVPPPPPMHTHTDPLNPRLGPHLEGAAACAPLCSCPPPSPQRLTPKTSLQRLLHPQKQKNMHMAAMRTSRTIPNLPARTSPNRAIFKSPDVHP